MKRLLAIGLFVNAALLAGILLKKDIVVHAAGGGGGVPIGNGDVNGDGKIDISAGVYILSWLFTGGPEPVAIECPPPAGKGLPATGQTKCHDGAGIEIDCGSADFPGQDGFYQAGCPSDGRFVDNGDGTVTDKCTELMWQRNTADADGDGSLGAGDSVTWQEALKYCGSLDFAGHTDWRIPNVRELQSIVDHGSMSPAIGPAFGAQAVAYWSSSSVPYNTRTGSHGGAWIIEFDRGGTFLGGFSPGGGEVVQNFVRAVRNAP